MSESTIEQQLARRAAINAFWQRIDDLRRQTTKAHRRLDPLLMQWQELLSQVAAMAEAEPGTVEAELYAEFRAAVPEELQAAIQQSADVGQAWLAAIYAVDVATGHRYFGLMAPEEVAGGGE